MVLRNAFEAMATEDTQESVFDVLYQILEELRSRRPPAVDAADRMRVSSDVVPVSTPVSLLWGNSQSYPAWYAGTGSPGSIDAREQLAVMANTNFNQARQQRWVL